ncbi:MAG: CC0125/CC1285 family lipoprotein [Parvularcula sp.]
MRKILVAAAALMSVSACAVTPAYGPSMSPGDIGYREQRIENDRYRISYRGKTPAAAADGALRRAAELTTENGYDYFTVVTRDVEGEARRRGPSVGIGGSTGSGRGWSGTRVGVGVNVPLTGPSQETLSRLEIVMGRGIPPKGSQSYNARDVLENLVR